MAHTGRPVAELMGRADMLKTLKQTRAANEQFGVITVGRHHGWKSRAVTRAQTSRSPVSTMGWKISRTQKKACRAGRHRKRLPLVRSLTWCAPGRLVHVSQLSHKFVTDAREVVKTGDIVKSACDRSRRGAQTHRPDDEVKMPSRRDAPRITVSRPVGASGSGQRGFNSRDAALGLHNQHHPPRWSRLQRWRISKK
jgi:uncharacterized protein